MKLFKILSLLVLTVCSTPCWSDEWSPSNTDAEMGPPKGWFSSSNATRAYRFFTTTAQGLPQGKRSAHIFRAGNGRLPSDKFATLMQSISAADYRGKRVSLSAQMKPFEIIGRAQLWMRIDGQNGQVLRFDNMEDRPITGTSGWANYSIVLDVPPASTAISFGFLLAGNGEIEAADFKLTAVAPTVATTASAPPEESRALPDAPANLDLSQM